MITRKQEFLDGCKAIIPLVLGAIPFGIIYGALAITAGISPLATLAMSLFVFAGSSQFIATGLFGAGASVGLIVLTTFIVNLRHMLYAASLAPYMRGVSHRWLIPLGHWLTDEAYAVVIKRYTSEENADSPYKHWFYLGAAVLMYANWQLCTVIGIVAGSTFENASEWGLDFAMVVTFIGIVVPLVVNRPMVGAVLASGSASLLFNSLPHQLGLMVSAVVGIAVGYVLETYFTPKLDMARIAEKGMSS